MADIALSNQPDRLAAFPPKLEMLFKPKRYKVLYGGRGAGRSWGCARALLLIGTGQVPGLEVPKPLRVLCAREYQNSIADSVHRVIADQIDNLGMNYLYEVQRDRILGRDGTPTAGVGFAFEGIKNNTNRIRSYEGIGICWIEEAVNVTRQSWGVLIPTIRREGSEIWLTFNPELENDYTYVRFVLEGDPASMAVAKMTWRDNPFFPQVLREEMERDRERDPDYYLNVWEGHCIQALEGAIYAKELRRCQEAGRIGKTPWDPEYPVETAWDLGRADATAIWFFQRIALQVRFIDYCTASGEDLSYYLNELQKRPYHYGKHWLPHDAGAKRLGAKKTIQEMLAGHYGWSRVNPLVMRHSLTDGINAARLLLKKCWFDEKRCTDGLSALRHYQYDVVNGQRRNEPKHDWASDGSDAFRYAAVAMGQAGRPSIESVLDDRLNRYDSAMETVRDVGRRAASTLGWMR